MAEEATTTKRTFGPNARLLGQTWLLGQGPPYIATWLHGARARARDTFSPTPTHFDALTNPTAHSHLDDTSYTSTHPYSDAYNPNSHTDAYTRTNANAYTHSPTHFDALTNPSAHSHPDDTSYSSTHPYADAYNPNSHTDSYA